MNRKFLLFLIIPLIAFIIVVIGCGGGGGSASSLTSTSSSTTSGATGGGVLKLVAENSNGIIIDPTNLVPGQSVQFMMVSIDPSTYAVTPETARGFTTTDSSGSAGSLNAQTGQFTAGSSTNGTNFTVSVSFQGSTYSELYGVKPLQAIVTGKVLDSNLVPIPFAEVVFEDSTDTQVGAVVTGVDGTFTASVPVTAVRFNLVPSTLPITANPSSVPSTAYFRYFTYGSGTYNPLNTACSAPIISLTSGQTNVLPNQIIVMAATTLSGAPNTPPPPPGCTP